MHRFVQVWADICQWLQERGLILHVPMKGPIWFEGKITRQRVTGF